MLARNRLSATTRFDLQEKLVSLIGTDVDLVDLRKLNLEIVRRIVLEHLEDFLAFARLLVQS